MTTTVIKQNKILFLCVTTFIAGFIAGIAFSVWKMDISENIKENKSIKKNSSLPTKITEQELASNIKKLQEITKRAPDNAKAWEHLGNMYYDTNQSSQAITAYEKSLTLQEASADLLTDLGVMYLSSGVPEKALAQFNQAAALDPEHIHSRFNRGIVLFHHLEKKEEAIVSWQEILKIDPQATTAHGEPIAEMINRMQTKIQQEKKGQNEQQ